MTPAASLLFLVRSQPQCRSIPKVIPPLFRAGRLPLISSSSRRAFTAKRSATNSTIDDETDVLVVGTGASALVAALRARARGLRVIMIEKEKWLGGTSVISGGGFWVPGNPVGKALGIQDSKAAALKYFEQAVGDVGPASSLERRHAFLENAPKMVEFLQEQGFQFHLTRRYPDYYQHLEGAMGETGGRSLESKAFDTRKLGSWESLLPPVAFPAPMYTDEATLFQRLASSPAAFASVVGKMVPKIFRALLGQKLATLGRGLVAQLLHLNTKQPGLTDIRLETALSTLIQDPDGRVVGATVDSTRGSQIIRAHHAVILATGGFANNIQMRQEYMPKPASTNWTSAPKGDTGDGVVAGMKLGAAVALMDDAWWGPTIIDPVTGSPGFMVSERARPHTIIVDQSGVRFMNEAQSYTDAGQELYRRNETVKAIPAWMILDTNYRRKYMLGRLFPRKDPKEALADGRMFKASTVEALAQQIGVDPDRLSATVQNFNTMCQNGIDTDYDKGGNCYDRFFGDPAVHPNPNMGPLERAPFYAIQIWPGDLGTKGGLLTDEFQRVVNNDHQAIEGLFAIGNTAASIMGRRYLGAGSTLGPAMTHGYIAADYIAS